MSMTGRYIRVPPAAIEDLRSHPETIVDFLFPEEDPVEIRGRRLDIDKSWHAIHFLLNGDPWDGEWPLAATVLGGTELGEDLGYGPARFLIPDEVRAVADALYGIPAFELLERYDADAMNEEQIYPHGWGNRLEPGCDETLDFVGTHYLELVNFFRRAAEAGDALILYLC